MYIYMYMQKKEIEYNVTSLKVLYEREIKNLCMQFLVLHT